MHKSHKQFFTDLKHQGFDSTDIKWITSGDDANFFNNCIEQLKLLDVKNVFDLGSGEGNFIDLCLKNGIEAMGLDPNNKKKPEHIIPGTFESLIKYIELQDFSSFMPKFDCITIHNILHGIPGGRASQTTDIANVSDMLVKLFRIFKIYAKYIIISDPSWNIFETYENFDILKLKKDCLKIKKNIYFKNCFKQIYTFPGSHSGKSVFHKIYEVVE